MTRYNPDGTVQSRASSQPVSGGREIVQYNQDGTVKSRSRLQGERDSHGNVIRKVRSESIDGSDNFRPVEVQYVIIEYYGQD